MSIRVSDDDDVNDFFEDVAIKLVNEADYSPEEARVLASDYYQKFTDPEYCMSIGVVTQDDEFFFHQGVSDIARRIHYYLKLKLDPNPEAYLRWRDELMRPRGGA